MQGVEALLWYWINHSETETCTPSLAFASIAPVSVALCMQPLSALYGVWVTHPEAIQHTVFAILLTVSLTPLVVSGYEMVVRNDIWCVLVTPGGYLDWTPNGEKVSIGWCFLWALLICTPLLLWARRTHSTVYICLNVFCTLLFTAWYIPEAIGSNWCLFQSMLGFILLVRYLSLWNVGCLFPPVWPITHHSDLLVFEK